MTASCISCVHILHILDLDILVMTSLLSLVYPSLPYPEYATDIAPTLTNPLVVVLPSFLTPTFVMPFDLLALERLIMLSK